MQRVLLTVFFFTAFIRCSFATHIRAGEITYKQISVLTYEFTVVEYVKETSGVVRTKLSVSWGDNTGSEIYIADSTMLSNDTRMRIYKATHTYAGAGSYLISITDQNRNADVINIPNSVNVAFYVETLLNIDPFLGYNHSPILLNPPLDRGAVYKIFTHNPGAYDPDGDVLYYRLVACKDASGHDIIGYQYPVANAGKFIKIDSLTGDVVWDAPQKQGEYNIAIRIEEYRNGHLMGYVIRDMQIEIGVTDNNPPIIIANDTCVEAGTNLVLHIRATDPEHNTINVTVKGGPLVDMPNPAGINVSSPSQGNVTATFTWQTACRHVRKDPYEVTIKAEDDGNNNLIKLVAITSIKIYVLEPAPKNVTTTPAGNTITVKWDKSECPRTTGYRVYRKSGPYNYAPAACDTGLPASSGYQLIANLRGSNNNSYLDNNKGGGLYRGNIYCYRVVATYPNQPVDSLPDEVRSKASMESCTELKRDLPVIVKVSVEKTDSIYGKISLRWVKPDPLLLDTVLNPPPYKLELYRAEGLTGSNALLVTRFQSSANRFNGPNGLNDTLYTDSIPKPAPVGESLNTMKTGYSYYLKLYSNGNLLGTSNPASSLFLQLSPSDNKIMLNWKRKAPWNTLQYDVYKETAASQFSKIATVQDTLYTDIGFANGTIHRYYVLSTDTFSSNGYPKDLFNKSEIAASASIDNVPPCPPVLTVKPDCERYLNILEWTNPNTICADDVWKFYIYHRKNQNENWPANALDSVVSPAMIPFSSNMLQYENSGLVHSIAGCYGIVAVDSVGNRSIMAVAPCVDNCPDYKIPKFFTPDGDGTNEVLQPYKNRYVEAIDIKIFNRWGQLMFQTKDININWNGQNQQNGGDCSDGVYFYVAEITQTHLDGPEKIIIKGFVEIFRNKH